MNSVELGKYFKDKKILITGNTGFKGSWLSLLLHSFGSNVYGFASDAATSKNLISSIAAKYVTKQFNRDIRNFSELKVVIDEVNPDIVFHLAASALTLKAYESPLLTIETNAMGTANLLECLRVNDQKINGIIITSDKCYRNNEWEWGYRENDILAGLDPYSASKSLAEIVTNSYYNSFFKSEDKVKVCTCRAGNVIGGGDWSDDRIIPDAIKAWRNGESLKLRSPGATRPWSYVLDVLWGYLLAAYALDKGTINGESFNFGPSSNNEITVKELTTLLWNYLPGERQFEPVMTVTQVDKSIEHQYLKLSSEKAAKYLNWQSTFNIVEAAKETAKWYHNYFQNEKDIEEISFSLIQSFLSKQKHE